MEFLYWHILLSGRKKINVWFKFPKQPLLSHTYSLGPSHAPIKFITIWANCNILVIPNQNNALSKMYHCNFHRVQNDLALPSLHNNNICILYYTMMVQYLARSRTQLKRTSDLWRSRVELTTHNWQKWKKIYSFMYICHKICTVQAVGPKVPIIGRVITDVTAGQNKWSEQKIDQQYAHTPAEHVV